MSDLTIFDAPMVQVTWDQGLPVPELRGTTSQPFLLSDILREGDSIATIADNDVLRRVANHFDLSPTATDYLLAHMVVRRPRTGNITIEAKPTFGAI